jgi:VWFA-related protein
MLFAACRYGAVIWIICLLSTALLAQSGRRVPPQNQGDKPLVKVETREVLLPLRAYDAEGKDISDLRPQDLIVTEEGIPRTITQLKHEPANIVLVLDLNTEIGTFKNGASTWNSGPKKDKPESSDPFKKTSPILARPATRELADNFAALLAPGDHLAIIQYADKAQLVQDWTLDRNTALAALQSKYRGGIKSSLYDALMLAAEKLRERDIGRRVMVLVSDGMDSASRARRQQALTALAQAQATVFVIGWAEVLRHEIENAIVWNETHRRDGVEILGSGPQKRAQELRRFLPQLEGAAVQLTELAEASGGEILLPQSFEEMVASPQRVIKEIGAQYTLAYITERRPSLESMRAVEVYVKRPGATIRTRRSYFIDDEARKKSGKQLFFADEQ